MNYFALLKKVIKLFDRRFYISCLFITIILSISILLDIGSIFLIMPLIGLILNPSISNIHFEFMNKYTQCNGNRCLLYLLIFITFSFLVRNLISVLILRYSRKIALLNSDRVLQRLYEIYFNLSIDQIILRDRSKMSNAISYHMERFLHFVHYSIVMFANIFSFIMLFLFLTFVFTKYVILIIVSVGTILSLYHILLKKTSGHVSKERATLSSKIDQLIHLPFEGVKELSLFDINDNCKLEIKENQKKMNILVFQEIFSQFIAIYFVEFVLILIIIIIGLSSIFMDNFNALLPTISSIVFTILRIFPIGMRIPFFYSNLKLSMTDTNNIAEEIELYKNFNPQILVRNEDFNRNIFEKNIVFKDVSFKYHNSSLASLESVNVSIDKNDVMGLIGLSGAGKSTFADLLCGFLKPTSGEILIDGNIVDFNIWRNYISYVPQNISFNRGKLKDLITFSINKEKINYELLEYAIEISQLNDMISKLPNGIETEIGNNALSISGGQRQRIGIARAIYFNRDVLILDEATSSLDAKTELAITNAINNLKYKKTIIIIAHRFSTLKYCNKIAYFSERKILDVQPSFEELTLKYSEIDELMKMNNIKAAGSSINEEKN